MTVNSDSVFGNTTDLMYYYLDVTVGDQKQSLILDTASGIVAFPCEGYCVSCGQHVNEWYRV